jgi:hypothetical protein
MLAEAAEVENFQNQLRRVIEWFGVRDDYDPAWSDAAFNTDRYARADPQQLGDLGRRLNALVVGRAADREAKPPLTRCRCSCSRVANRRAPDPVHATTYEAIPALRRDRAVRAWTLGTGISALRDRCAASSVNRNDAGVY